MIKFVNRFTGSAMYVADERKEEYLAAGHKPAVGSSPAKKEEAVKENPEKETRSAKKAAPKKK